MNERRKIDRAFKLETVKLVTELGRTSVVQEIGVHDNTIFFQYSNPPPHTPIPPIDSLY